MGLINKLFSKFSKFSKSPEVKTDGENYEKLRKIIVGILNRQIDEKSIKSILNKINRNDKNEMLKYYDKFGKKAAISKYNSEIASKYPEKPSKKGNSQNIQKDQSSSNDARLPDYFLIVCDKQPKMKNEFIMSVIESRNCTFGKNTIIELKQYYNAQTLDSALPYAIALALSRFEEFSLELDVGETAYREFRSLSSGIPIYGYSFTFFRK